MIFQYTLYFKDISNEYSILKGKHNRKIVYSHVLKTLSKVAINAFGNHGIAMQFGKLCCFKTVLATLVVLKMYCRCVARIKQRDYTR